MYFISKPSQKCFIGFSKVILFLLIILFQPLANASPITIIGRNVIDRDTTYEHRVLDLTRGYFVIENNAKLVLDHCLVLGSLNPEKTHLIYLNKGSFLIQNSLFNISTTNIPENPLRQSIYSVFFVSEGQVNLFRNRFTIDKPYTASLFVTDKYPTRDINIRGNQLEYYHGGFILNNTQNAILSGNQFSRVSTTNILLLKSKHSRIENNEIFFSGNNNIGDGIDLIDSENIALQGNTIASGSCYSVSILRCKKISLESNRIMGGITHAIIILGASVSHYPNPSLRSYFEESSSSNNTASKSQDIKITHNYLSQNRYGIAASNVEELLVTDNLFIQRFLDDKKRKFWTNNEILLKEVKNLTWLRNKYKEAYPQKRPDSVEKSSRLLEFPTSGGVSL